jgi:tetratricopeptide (TPR) repeat protein
MASTHGRLHAIGLGRAWGAPGAGLCPRHLGVSTGVMRVATFLIVATLTWAPAARPADALPPTDGTLASEPAPAPAAVAPAPALSPGEPPHDLSDLPGWLDYRSRSHAIALPLEARIFYRRGLFAHESGMLDEGVRWVRGAAELDPSYVAPHLTLAAWALFREPSQALLQYATVLDLARGNFLLQLAVMGNVLYVGFGALVLALLAAGCLIVLLRIQELRHPLLEKLSRVVSPGSARAWSLALVLLPYAAGFGPALPTVALLGFLWCVLRGRERVLFVTLTLVLAALPWMSSMLDRMATPLDEARAPLHGVPLLEGEPWSRERQDRMTALAARHPDNPFVRFGLGWIARRGGDLVTAEAAYRRVLQTWPDDDRVLNDLGNVLAMQGRTVEALTLYDRANAKLHANAAAYFNSSQLYTQRFEYRAATEALSRASSLDFDMVRNYQSQSTEDGMLPLVDQWIAPRAFWLALMREPLPLGGAHSLPPAWRTRIEASGWPFSLAAVILALLGVSFSLVQHGGMPLRACSNCGHVVCRRCAQRRRELALCPACAALESRAENPDFARVLLLQHQRQLLNREHLVRTAAAAVVPGFGLLAFRRVFTPVVLLALTTLLAAQWFGSSLPFEFEPRLALAPSFIPVPLALALWGAIYAASLFGYFEQVARARAQASSLAAPVRSRSVQATRRTPAAAA